VGDIMNDPYLVWLKDEIKEIKSDVKLLLAERNQRIGIGIVISFIISLVVTLYFR
jgi:hypothetical protein